MQPSVIGRKGSVVRASEVLGTAPDDDHQDTPSPVLDFAGFRFDPERGLFRAGRPIHLARKELRGLSLLLARCGAVVSRDEYVQSVWPRGDASDDSIARSVYLLRRALGTHGGGELVETVYGVGYRLTAPVSLARTQSASATVRLAATPHAAAFETFQVARQLRGKGTRAGLEAAVRAFERAARIDSGYAPAWAAIAECHAAAAIRGYADPRHAGRQALAAAERALAIDPDDPGALAVRGWVQGAIEGRIDLGMADLARAIGLDPCFWLARFYRAWLLPARGRCGEALDEARAAVELNPLHPAPRALVGWLLFCSGRAQQALTELRGAACELHEPEEVWRTLSLVSAASGSTEALELAQRMARASDCARSHAAVLAYVLARRGDTTAARRIVQAWGDDTRSLPAATHAAAAHLALGDSDAAAAAWSHAEEQGCPHRVFAAHDPRLAELFVFDARRAQPSTVETPQASGVDTARASSQAPLAVAS